MILRILALIVFFLLFNSCNKICKVDNFTQDELSLLPKIENKSIVFKNNNNKLLLFRTSNYVESKSTYDKKHLFGSNKTEIIQREINFINDSLNINFLINKECNSSAYNLKIQIKKNFLTNFFDLFFLENAIYEGEKLAIDTVILNKRFEKVIIAPYFDKYDYDTLFYSNFDGIIQFKDKNGMLWTLDK